MTREPDPDLVRDFVIASLTHPSSYGTSDGRLFVTWGLTPFVVTRDSDILEVSNYESVLRDLSAEFPDDTDVQHAGHWAVGWCDTVLVRVLRERPEAPEKKLRGNTLLTWEASWEYDEAKVKSLHGAALNRWIETRVTPAAVRAASIMAALQDYPVWDEADLSERETEKMEEAWDEAWSDLHRCWQDIPAGDDGEPYDDYDGPPLPVATPGYDNPDFGFVFEAFSETWTDHGGDCYISGEELKAIILAAPEYSAWLVQREQVPGQGELFEAPAQD